MRFPTAARTTLTGAALVALLAGCGGGDDERAAIVGSPTSTPTTLAPAGPAVDAGGPTTTAGPAVPGGGNGGAGAARVPGTPDGSAEASAGWPPPAAGTYRYATSGVSTFLVSSLPFPAVTTLVVDPPNGTRQHATRDLRDGSGSGSIQETSFDYRPEGIFLESLKLTAIYAGTTNTIDLRPVGSALFLPVGAGPGTHLEMEVTDGAGNARVVVDVPRREAVDVGGQAVDALVVNVVATLPGPDVSGQVTLTDWFAPSARLVVKESSVSDATAGGGLVRFHSEYEATLQELP